MCSKNFDGERLWALTGTRKDGEQKWAWREVSTNGRQTGGFVDALLTASASLQLFQELVRRKIFSTPSTEDENEGSAPIRRGQSASTLMH